MRCSGWSLARQTKPDVSRLSGTRGASTKQYRWLWRAREEHGRHGFWFHVGSDCKGVRDNPLAKSLFVGDPIITMIRY